MTQKKKQISVRKQKIKKNHVREKLIFFTILAMVLLVVAAFARKLCPYDPDIQDLLLAQKPPSSEHILGTDRYGRDMLSRVLVGSTTSIYATLFLVAIITVLGTVIGIICGWCGGIIDTVLMRISDLFLALPSVSIGRRRKDRLPLTEPTPLLLRTVSRPGRPSLKRIRRSCAGLSGKPLPLLPALMSLPPCFSGMV